MSIENSRVIDIIGSSELDKQIVLVITDHLDWSKENEESHLLMLQNKINLYLAYIESGEILERYPNSEEYLKKIKVVCKYKPIKNAVLFFESVDKIIKEAGFAFEYEVSNLIIKP